MNKPAIASLAGLLSLALVSASVQADNSHRHDRRYEITVTNLTGGQVISPPLVVTHPRSIALFEIGEPASDGLAALAQDADTDGLVKALDGEPGVRVVVGDGVIPPGKSATIEVRARSSRSVLSIAAMLVTSNDAFVAVDSASLPRYGSREMTAIAYDAGSEANNELCEFIPGPPCGMPKSQDPNEEIEGFVFVHAGIHGVGDLEPARNDWRNPVAKVRVRRIWR